MGGGTIAFQDFRSYTKADPTEDKVVRSTHQVTWNLVDRGLDVGVYCTVSASEITDFDHSVEVYCSLRGAPVGVWGVSDKSLHTLQDIINEAMGITVYWGSAGNYLVLHDHVTNTYDTSVVLSLSTPYYLLIRRAATTLTCKIYSDEDRTTLVDTLTVTPCTEYAFSVICAMLNYDNASFTGNTSGYVRNLDLLAGRGHTREHLHTYTQDSSGNEGVPIDTNISIFSGTSQLIIRET